jgi:uncharacterized membrane protein
VKTCLISIVAYPILLCSAFSQNNQKTVAESERARVFITDSQSWSVAGQSGGAGGAFGGTMAGGARPQTAEIRRLGKGVLR